MPDNHGACAFQLDDGLARAPTRYNAPTASEVWTPVEISAIFVVVKYLLEFSAFVAYNQRRTHDGSGNSPRRQA